MRNLSDTIARLTKLQGQGVGGGTPGGGTLEELTGFGSNPGALRAFFHVPASLPDGAALVVVLHGCTQTASGYDIGAGWSQMADRHGFAVLFPEQQRQNNANLCFNWFSPEDNRRDSGEALSIRQMIAALAATHPIDPARVYVTGLSAGGAMASVMLATYPELFAGGAIIAGLPYRCARTVPEAFDRMRGHGLPDAAELTALVRRASDGTGPWPTVSVWHGSADATVSPVNAEAIVGQWRTLHGVDALPSRTEMVGDHSRRVWCDRDGREVIEQYSITGMGHGTPIDTSGADGCGKPGAYMLEAGISSTARLCRFWGLAGEDGRSVSAPVERRPVPRERVPASVDAVPPRARTDRPASGTPAGVGKVIEDALRAAGLMR